MATKAKASSVVRKEKKVRETSPSNLHTPVAAANLCRKTRPIAKQTTPIPPQNPLPNPRKPTIRSSRLDASKPGKIPAAVASSPRPYLHRRRSFDNKPSLNHNASRGGAAGGARKALHKSLSLSTSSRPPHASSKPVSRMLPSGRRLGAGSAEPRTRKEEAADQPNAAARLIDETEAVLRAAAEISSCPDLDECMSNMESEHEEAEGLMGCAIDDELAEIESRGMSSPRGPIISPLLENSPPSVEIEAKTDDFDEGSGNAKDGEGNEARAAQVGDTEEVESSGQNEAVEAGSHGEEKGEAEDDGGGEDSRAKSQSGGGGGKWKKAYNDVIEETKGKLMEERKNKVRALVGAFETVISLQDPPTHPES